MILLVIIMFFSAAVSDSCVKMLGTKSQQHLDALKILCESTRPEVRTPHEHNQLFNFPCMEQYDFQRKSSLSWLGWNFIRNNI
jgi:hypothetical protein